MAVFKAAKVGGVVLNIAGILISAWDMKRNGINAKNATDMAMGGVAFMPGVGWLISGVYFTLEAFYPGGIKGIIKDQAETMASLNELCNCDASANFY